MSSGNHNMDQPQYSEAANDTSSSGKRSSDEMDHSVTRDIDSHMDQENVAPSSKRPRTEYTLSSGRPLELVNHFRLNSNPSSPLPTASPNAESPGLTQPAAVLSEPAVVSVPPLYLAGVDLAEVRTRARQLYEAVPLKDRELVTFQEKALELDWSRTSPELLILAELKGWKLRHPAFSLPPLQLKAGTHVPLTASSRPWDVIFLRRCMRLSLNEVAKVLTKLNYLKGIQILVSVPVCQGHWGRDAELMAEAQHDDSFNRNDYTYMDAKAKKDKDASKPSKRKRKRNSTDSEDTAVPTSSSSSPALSESSPTASSSNATATPSEARDDDIPPEVEDRLPELFDAHLVDMVVDGIADHIEENDNVRVSIDRLRQALTRLIGRYQQ